MEMENYNQLPLTAVMLLFSCNDITRTSTILALQTRAIGYDRQCAVLSHEDVFSIKLKVTTFDLFFSAVMHTQYLLRLMYLHGLNTFVILFIK